MGVHTNGQRVSDNYYTQGFEIRARWQAAPTVGITFGAVQHIYTPNSVSVSNLARLVGDQPYAGWTYGFVGLQKYVGWWTFGAELDAGVIGPQAQAGRVQSAWHQFLRWTLNSRHPISPAALGSYEIANATGIDLSFSAEGVFANFCWHSKRSARQVGLRLYSTTFVEAGTVYGRVASGGGLRIGLFGTSPVAVPRITSELYLFAQMELMGVAWNQLVQGPLVSGAPNETQLRHLLPVGSLGLVWRHRHFGLFLGQVIQPQALTSLPERAEYWHHYGQVELNWGW